MSERPVLKGECIDGEKLEALGRWNERQAFLRFEMGAILDNLIAWDDEYPEDERGVVDLSGTAENLTLLLEAFKEEVRRETLKWVADELTEVSGYWGESPKVNWKALSEVMEQEHGWKEVADEETDQE